MSEQPFETEPLSPYLQTALWRFLAWRDDCLRREGRANGIPRCCVEAFVADFDRYPAELRGAIERSPGDVYVPCDDCRSAHVAAGGTLV